MCNLHPKENEEINDIANKISNISHKICDLMDGEDMAVVMSTMAMTLAKVSSSLELEENITIDDVLNHFNESVKSYYGNYQKFTEKSKRI